jgi:T4 RnlA family RNA ligase
MSVSAVALRFHQDGTIAARTLHKFFNIGERPETQPEVLDWANIVRVMVKRDGSMVTPVMLPQNNFKFKTKKSFSTGEAAVADRICDADQLKYQWVLAMIYRGLTPTFEITSPKLPIVLRYTTEELTLLHIRENISGRYLTEPQILALNPPFPLVQNVMEDFLVGDNWPVQGQVSWGLLKEAALNDTHVEGWVIQFKNGEMVKLKTKWYIELHHKVTFIRKRDVARAVLADTVDDLRGAFALAGFPLEPIDAIQSAVKTELASIKSQLQEIVNPEKSAQTDAKTMALKYNGHEHFSLIMALHRGKEINWIEWYERNRLNNWDLEVIG